MSCSGNKSVPGAGTSGSTTNILNIQVNANGGSCAHFWQGSFWDE